MFWLVKLVLTETEFKIEGIVKECTSVRCDYSITIFEAEIRGNFSLSNKRGVINDWKV